MLSITKPATKNIKIKYKVNPTSKEDHNTCRQKSNYVQTNKRRI